MIGGIVMRKKIILVILLLIALFVFVYYGIESEIPFIREKAQDVMNDEIIKKIISDYGTVSAETKDYIVYREIVKSNNPKISERNLVKQYIAYSIFAKKAEELGITLTPEEIEQIKQKSEKLVLSLPSGDISSNKMGSEISKMMREGENVTKIFQSINEQNILSGKFEESLKKEYDGEDFDKWLGKIKEKLLREWQIFNYEG